MGRQIKMSAPCSAENSPRGVPEEKVDKCIALMDKNGDGIFTMEEAQKFLGALEGKEVSQEDIESTPDISKLVDKPTSGVKELIMKMCDEEEKLDAIIAALS